MDPARILITGAAGFVGRHLLPLIRVRFPSAEVIGTSAEPRPDLRVLDITDQAGVGAIVRAVRPDVCIHLAAVSAVPAARADAARAWRVNLQGTLALAQAILAEMRTCRLLFVSSADVYGASFRAGRPLDETAAAAPANIYGATKAAADLAIGALVAAEGLQAIRLRPFNHTGPGQTAQFAVPAFARQIARIEAGLQEPVLRVGALDPQRDFLDVRDVCRAYIAAIGTPLDPGTILNLASGTPRRIGDILAELLAIAGVDARIEAERAALRAGDTPFACGDPRLAQARLGWRPAIAWSTTLADVIEDWRARVRNGTD